MSVTREPFGETTDGRPVDAFIFENSRGIKVKLINYGAAIVSVEVPDRHGNMADVVLGFDDMEGYQGADNPFFGACCGRYANRIAGGRFTLDGVDYSLAVNNGPNTLHGGQVGFDKKMWGAEVVDDAVRMSMTSPDGEEGYPGTLVMEVTYTLTSSNELVVDYRATTDKATPVNLTQHAYFNLKDAGASNILGHELMIAADGFTPVGATLIPTGEIAPVEGTPFDFTNPHSIGERIGADHPQMVFGGGYDHNWVLNGTAAAGMTLAARVHEPTTGRTLEIRTTEPAIQFYSGNFLDGTLAGKDGVVYQHRTGFCLETQHYPDSPNQPGFPSTILHPGEEYSTRTVFRFGVRGNPAEGAE